jgi:hypothetical protein
MSSSIVLAVAPLPGVEAVLVMAVLGLFSAAVLAMCQAAPRVHVVVPVHRESGRGERRPLTMLSVLSTGRWSLRGRRTGSRGASPQAAPSEERVPVPIIGYATYSGGPGKEAGEDLAKQARVIGRVCEQRGLTLVKMVGDPHEDRQLFRPKLLEAPPGLGYALKRIAAGQAQGLVVAGLRRLTNSAAGLGPIVEWFVRRDVRLIAVAQGFDTADRAGQVAARLIIEVSRWEREGLWQPWREGQSPSASAGPSGGPDDESDLLSRKGGEWS